MVGRVEADSLYHHHVAETNPFSPLLLPPAVCEERVWPQANVQIWVLVIGLLPTVAKVKLLCAFCCFLRVTVEFCSCAKPCFIIGVRCGNGAVRCIWRGCLFLVLRLVLNSFI